MNSPHKGQWRRALVFSLICLNKRLSKQSWGWWSETLSHPLWRHCNANLTKCLAMLIGTCCVINPLKCKLLCHENKGGVFGFILHGTWQCLPVLCHLIVNRDTFWIIFYLRLSNFLTNERRSYICNFSHWLRPLRSENGPWSVFNKIDGCLYIYGSIYALNRTKPFLYFTCVLCTSVYIAILVQNNQAPWI